MSDYRLRSIPAAAYFADPCEVPSLSQSTAHTLVNRSPLHAHRFHPKLGRMGKETTKEMDAGSVVHALVLGADAARSVTIVPHPDYRTNAARAMRDAAYDERKTPILAHEYERCVRAADAVRRQLESFAITLAGQTEGVALWKETADDGTEVLCRGMLDHWDAPQIDDLKTTHDAHPLAISRTLVNHGYDIQAAAYLSAVEKLFPDLAGRCKFRFVFVEMEEPYPVTPVIPDGSILTLGRSKWRRAVNLWAKCLRENNWPGYATEPLTISARPWDVSAELDSSPSPASTFPF